MGGGGHLSEVAVRELAASELDVVFDLQARLYARDPAWVAPVREIERRRTRPWLEKGRLTLLAAERSGEVVGTISVLVDQDLAAHLDERVVWFGFFETIDDQAVVDALLAEAASRARASGGDRLRGPRNLTRFDNVGVTVEGFDRRPSMLQGHHPAYYAERLEAAGFHKHHDVLAYETALVEYDGTPRTVPAALHDKAELCDVEGLVVRAARWRSMRADLLAAHAVMNEAFETVPDTSPFPRESFVQLGRVYLAFSNVNLLQLALVGDEPVGFAACFPDMAAAFQAMHGHALPVGWARMLAAMRRVDTASFKLIGVKQAYRGRGVHARLIEAIVHGAQKAGYTRIEGSVIDERNLPMRGVVESVGMTIWKRYRFYERAL